MVIAESPLSPGLPFIASADLPPPTIALIRSALLAALADPALSEARKALGLERARVTAPADYERIIEIERSAEVAGYKRLA